MFASSNATIFQPIKGMPKFNFINYDDDFQHDKNEWLSNSHEAHDPKPNS